MKPILLLLAALSLPATLFGQGQVQFLNTSGTPITIRGEPISGVNAYRIGLYTAPPGTLDASMFTLVAVATNSTLVAGRIGAGGGYISIAGNNGTPIAYQVKVWSLHGGSSFEQAVINAWPPPPQGAVWFGSSPISGPITPAIGGAPAHSVFGSGPGSLPDFPGQLNVGIALGTPLPEPSTYALAALGIVMSLFFRKRR